MATWLINEGPTWLLITIWLMVNVGLFVSSYLQFAQGKEYFYLRVILGHALPVARGSAACLNLNCMLVMLPICRNLFSFARGAFHCRYVRRSFDKSIRFHKYFAYMICLQTAIHTGAHCFNFERFVQAHDSSDLKLRDFLYALSQLPITENGTYMNPVRKPNVEPVIELFRLLPGSTGVVITLCLILMVSSATDFIRRFYFEVFWFTHHLFVIFFIGLILHGFQGVVRYQTNINEHDPNVCHAKFEKWGKDPDCLVYPHFSGKSPQAWKWVVVPLSLYIVECIIRLYRRHQKVFITKVVKHPCDTIQLQLKRAGGFKMEPGQYVFLQCPVISRLEWHPFTLTSAPSDDYISVHIRRVGDWTNALAKACFIDDNITPTPDQLPIMTVDGPFGTATEDVFTYKVDVFIGTGIGVTPFASVLKYISASRSHSSFLEKVYFFWICPNPKAFQWFQDLLVMLEKKFNKIGEEQFLSYHIYLTQGWDANQAGHLMLHAEDSKDPITRLQQKTFFGRPRWDIIFTDIKQAHEGEDIGVFFCGSKPLSKILLKTCNKFSDPPVTKTNTKRTRFFFNKENF